MNTLGIASLGPGASVALFDNHNVLAAIEEEKLSRTNDPHGLPQLALVSVLTSSGLRLSDIGSIALADSGAASKKNPRKNSDHESALAHLRQLLAGRRFSRFDHHLCHAASSFYASDFSRSLILSLDHGANGNSGLVALGEDDQIKSLHSLSFPNSLGWFYSRVTQIVGLRPHRDEHKLQWLSKDGQSEYSESFRKLFAWNAKGLPVLDRKYFSAGADGAGAFSGNWACHGPQPPPITAFVPRWRAVHRMFWKRWFSRLPNTSAKRPAPIRFAWPAEYFKTFCWCARLNSAAAFAMSTSSRSPATPVRRSARRFSRAKKRPAVPVALLWILWHWVPSRRPRKSNRFSTTAKLFTDIHPAKTSFLRKPLIISSEGKSSPGARAAANLATALSAVAACWLHHSTNTFSTT